MPQKRKVGELRLDFGMIWTRRRYKMGEITNQTGDALRVTVCTVHTGTVQLVSHGGRVYNGTGGDRMQLPRRDNR